MGDAPTGTVTFLFTDVEGSTRLWEEHPEAMHVAMAVHDRLLSEAIEARGGYVFKTVGDAFCAAFVRATDALEAALVAQAALRRRDWGDTGPLRVRMALYAGEAEARDGDYFGPPLNRCARILAAGHGGQVLLSQSAAELVRDLLPAGAELQALGEHRLRDLTRPEALSQLAHPDLAADFPPLRSLAAFAHNLPLQMTSFVGREVEMEEVRRLLGTTRLLTLTGTGGAGKTRLALQVAADLLDEYSDGVWLVELAALSEPSLLPQAMLSALGLREEPQHDPLGTLADSLGPKHTLLILDNCEHLVAACAEIAEALLRSCSGLAILATSRETLQAEGETVWRVPSLSVPEPGRAEPVPLERLTQYEAVRLFIERALATRPGFHVTNESAPAVAEICWRLDGIPLAIELAAARVSVLAPAQIRERLDDRFHLLTGGRRTALPRQQTLRAAVDWSYELLPERERRLFERLSVFAGGFGLEAAHAICADEGAEGWETLDRLTELVEKSLVVADEDNGAVRYRLLETLRAYGAERLERSGEAQATRRRHAELFAARAEELHPRFWSPEAERWLAWCETEYANFRAALSWTQRHDANLGLRLATAFARVWEIGPHWAEGRAWLTQLLGCQEHIEPALRANGLFWAGAMAGAQSDYTVARALVEEAARLHRELDNQRGEARDLNCLGNIAARQGDYDAARSAQEQSLAINERVGTPQDVARSLHGLGLLAQEQGDAEAAESYYARALALYREADERRNVAVILNNVGNLAVARGNYPGALALHEEGLALAREMGDTTSIGMLICSMGLAALRQGDYTGAQALCEEAAAIHREVGAQYGVVNALLGVAQAARRRGKHAAAAEAYHEALLLSRAMDSKPRIADCLQGLAVLACDQAHMERAARLFGAGDALGQSRGAEVSDPVPYQASVEAASAALGEAAFAAAWAAGREARLDDVVREALRAEDGP
jgi:predicted ATPase/class 3 adenylate cyclase